MLYKTVSKPLFGLTDVEEGTLGAADIVDQKLTDVQVNPCLMWKVCFVPQKGGEGGVGAVGQISNNDKMEYRKEIDSLVAWCKDNNLFFD
eukprot:g29129.t1